MKIKKETYAMLAAILATGSIADAHIVALGWNALPGGSVQFSALHWHGNSEPDGYLLFDGVEYPFTSFIWDTPTITGFDGGLINSDYATWTPGSGTINAVDTGDGLQTNWLTVTVPNVTGGTHTIGSSDIALTEWTLDGDLAEFEFDFTGGGDSAALLSSTLRLTSISVARTVTRDVGDRLFRMRAGRPQAGGQQAAAAPAAATDAKGGMVQSSKSPIMMPAETRNWEVYGTVFYFTEDQDQQNLSAHTANGALVTRTVHPDTSVDIFGGNAGFEYRFNNRVSAGFAVGASTTDVDMTTIGSSDIDTLALMPYVSYYQEDLLGAADFYADALYAYGMNEYDTRRLSGGGIATGSPDGDFHQIELTTGLNYASGSLIHGPYASLRWLDGSIDGYTEAGPGAAIYPSADFESLATNLGYQVSYPMQLAGGVLVPQARAAWEHEFETDATGAFGLPGGAVDDDLAILGTGLGYYLNSGWNVALDYEARLGSENQSHYVGLKAGYEF
jgi:uncharacterized protein YhjY with autotransporter beta-barrel domain